tara:strand:- start:693 stop:1007 length:315 start_codon:yes stop_codon:yes gene_type:complete
MLLIVRIAEKTRTIAAAGVTTTTTTATMIALISTAYEQPSPKQTHPDPAGNPGRRIETMMILIPILATALLVFALAWVQDAPYRREMRRKVRLRQSVLNWRGRR